MGAMTQTKRRTRTAHPGVYIKKRKLPGGGVSYRARYTDPLTDKEAYKTLDVSLSTKELRREWAIDFARNLGRQRAALDAGEAPRSRTPIAEAVPAFFKARADRAASGLERRRTGIDRFVQWATAQRLELVEDLTPAHLSELRTWLVTAGRLVVSHEKRGARAPSASPRRPATINTDLTSVKILLNHWRAIGQTPKLSRDIISDNLKAVRVDRDEPEYLMPAQIRELLAAAHKHDAATFAETRDEHAGRRDRGTTLKYADAPILPFVMFLLFTGCRRGEALGLEWSDVDLDAVDQHGTTVGEIRLRAAQTKTKRGRTIGLEVSPALRAMLSDMRRASGGEGRVFDGYTAEIVDGARERMVEEFGAPAFTWHMLRATCATYLTCSHGIWGSATLFLSAKQLGHSVVVADKHYLGTHRGVPREARTLEDAMQLVPGILRGSVDVQSA